MNGAVIGKGASVEYSIIDNGAFIGENASVGGPKENGGLTVVAGGVTVGKDAVISPGAVAEEDI